MQAIMKKINIRRIYYLFRHKYFTLNNVVIVIAFAIATGWVWGSLGVMQRNYTLQKELDDKSRQLIVVQLDNENAKLEQRYYHTNEYQELAVRERLGLVTPGESVLILPPNSEAAKNADKTVSIASSDQVAPVSNFTQWLNFLFGSNNKKISS
jgi:cell division protein FtsB